MSHRDHRRGRPTFWADNNGAATIEAVIWVPIFIMLLGLIVDISLIFARHARR